MLKRSLEWINANWYSFTLALSILAAIIAWLFFGVSISQPFRDMQAKQAQSAKAINDIKYQSRLVKSGLLLGNTLLDDSRYMAADAEFKKIIAIDHLNPDARIGILKTEIYKNIHSHFIPVVMEKKIAHILTERPNDPHAFVLLGNLYMQMGKIPEAADSFQKAIDRKNPPSSAYYGMGLLHLKKNNITAAFDMFTNAVKKSELNEAYLNNLAYLYFLKGDFPTAIKNYETILNLDHEFILPYCEIALSYRLNGNLDKAIGYFKKLKKQLQNTALVNLDKNKGPWLFHSSTNLDLEATHLFEVNEKKMYAGFSLGATLFINGEKEAADIQMADATRIKTDRKSDIIDLVKRDLRKFEALHPEQSDSVYEFRRRFQKALLRPMP